MSISFILMIIALVCFIASAIGWPVTRLNLVAAGLASWVGALLVAMR